VEESLYGAGSDELLARMRAVSDTVGSVLVIGHNPGLQDLALQLAGSGPDVPTMRAKFPTAALATLAFDGSWRELAPGDADLVAFVKPKQLSG
jgi:phosphohistidine phosphatase